MPAVPNHLGVAAIRLDRPHRAAESPEPGGRDGQGVDGAFDDHDVRVAVKTVLGWPVERSRLVEDRGPGRVAVLGRPGVPGGIAADESVDAFAVPLYWDDQPAAVGVDQLAVAGRLGEVEVEQFAVADALTEQMPGQPAPVRGGVADDRLPSPGRAQRPGVDATCLAQVGLRGADAVSYTH